MELIDIVGEKKRENSEPKTANAQSASRKDRPISRADGALCTKTPHDAHEGWQNPDLATRRKGSKSNMR
jgi:hypothetical protein